jgi:hypothetical protein
VVALPVRPGDRKDDAGTLYPGRHCGEGRFRPSRLARHETIRLAWPGCIPSVLGHLGVIHDVGGSAVFADSNLMVFESGPSPLIADFLNYVTCGAFAQLAIRLVAGPADADPLRRTKPAPAGQKTAAVWLIST